MKIKNKKLTNSKILTLLEASKEGMSNVISQSITCAKYVENDPYTTEEKEAAKEHNKPLLKYPILISKLITLMGQEQMNRRETKIIAEYGTDEKVIKILSDHYDYLRERENFEVLFGKAFSDALIYPTGGWIQRKFKMGDDGYLTLDYSLLDTFSVHPDPEFKEMDLSDAQYIIIEKPMTLQEIELIYGKTPFDKREEQEWWQEVLGTISTFPDSPSEYKNGNRYTVLQLEEKRTVPINIVDINGEITKLSDAEVKLLISKKQDIRFIRRSYETKIYISVSIPYFDNIMIYDKQSVAKRFSAFPVFSFDFNMKKKMQPSFFSILLDVQDRISKGKSQEVDYLIQMLGASWHISQTEKNAIKQLKNSAGQPNAVIEYINKNNKATKEYPTGAGAAIGNVMNGIGSDLNFMDMISNVTPSLQGQAGKSGESGILFDKKREQSLTSTNTYYENLAKLRENLARDYCEVIPLIAFEDNRILPTKGENGLSKEIINVKLGTDVTVNDIKNVSMRAILDEGENTPNRLERAFQENIALANVLVTAGYPPENIPFDLIIGKSTIRDKQEWIQRIQMTQQIMREKSADAEANNNVSNITNIAKMIQGGNPNG